MTFQGVACGELCCELPLQESNLDYLIQSSPVGACFEDTMSASGDLLSIGALTVGGKCPHRSGEPLVKRLQELGTQPSGGTCSSKNLRYPFGRVSALHLGTAEDA